MSAMYQPNPLGTVSLIGAFTIIAGVFLNWGTGIIDISIGPVIIGHKYLYYTGWEIIHDQQLADAAPGLADVPECTLAIGIAALALSILPVLRVCTAGKALSAVCIPCGLSVLYLLTRLIDDISAADVTVHGMPLGIEIEYGIWICMAGAAVLIAGSAINILARRKDD